MKTLHENFTKLCSLYDCQYIPFNVVPQEFTPTTLLFLLRYWNLTKSEKALIMVTNILDNNYKSDLFDHIGLGFYNSCNKKELNHNALLIIAYLEVYQITGKQYYANIAEKTLNYIMRNLTSKDGIFFSAEISENKHLWIKKEIINELGKKDGEFFCKYYNITENQKSSPNLNKIKKIEDISVKDDFKLTILRQILFEKIEQKNNINTEISIPSNALMIIAFCMSYRIINEKIYKNYAKNAYQHITKLTNLSSLDYSYLTFASIELYQTIYDPNYLKSALIFNKNSSNTNLISALNLFKLSSLTNNEELKVCANTLLNSYKEKTVSSQIIDTNLLLPYIFSKTPLNQIIINGDINNIDTLTMIQTINDTFLPYTTVHIYSENINSLKELVNSINNQKRIDDIATAYIRKNSIYSNPITNLTDFKTLITQ